MKQKLDYDIIMLALPRWDGQYSSTAYSLAKELSTHTRVFYIDNPFTIKDYLAARHLEKVKARKNALLKGKDIYTKPDPNYPQLTVVTPRMILPINWLPSGLLYNAMSRLNDSLAGIAINRAIREHNIKKYIYINSFNPIIGRYFSFTVPPVLKVYQNVDDMRQTPYVGKHGVELEKEAIRKSDFSIVTSSELRRVSSAYSQKVYLLPNAANVKLFQRAVAEDLPVPDEIKQLSPGKKIICYTGNICKRLDYDLLLKIARTHNDKIMLIIGPTTHSNEKLSELQKLPNVVFTGRKNIDQLPAYLKYSHCCIIPFLCNQLTKSIYPLKINEYLSAGKPVITTNFSEDIFNFRSVAFVSNDHEEFVKSIEKAVLLDSEENKKQRVQYSSENNWEARARQFIEIAEEFLQRK